VTVEVREHDRRVSATGDDVPSAVASVLGALTLRQAPPGVTSTVDAAGMRWETRSWGSPADPPLVAGHGVMSDSGVYWRLGPALAAAGWWVIAVDLPAHGGTGPWNGRYALPDTAVDLAACVMAMDIDTDRLKVLGHSWSAGVAAWLPMAGLRPRALVLIDPPYLDRAGMAGMTRDRVEHSYETVDEARANLRAAYPQWTDGDVEAKARALTRFDPRAAAAVLSENGDWDAGLAALAHPAAADVAVWYVRGEPASGGLIPDDVLPELAARAGPDRVLTLAGGSHSPMRTRDPAPLAFALLAALEV
jgi:pimeloyl-ACP methyl ester carboxylesterase